MTGIIGSLKKHKDLYLIALHLGLTGYGGMAVVSQIRKEYVVKKNIVSERAFLNALSLAQILPGSNIIDLVAFFSYLHAGLIGAIIATTIYVLPTFIITTALAAFYFAYSNITFVGSIIQGFNILLVPLLIQALINIGASVFVRKGTVELRSIAITVLCFLLSYFYSLNALELMLFAGALGVFFYTATGFYGKADKELKAAETAFIRRKKAWGLLFAGIILFSLFLYFLSHPLWILFSSFLKIGSLSFGGGIAAIPLIQSLFVGNLHLFTPAQFWDGIAISQITPGPILISSAFFGYKVAGVPGAAVATIAMCIPSVILIILAGKVHGRIKDNTIVRGVIRGFLSAFIGILTALIVSQAHQSLKGWPDVLMALLALVLIFRMKRGFVAAFVATLAYALLFGRR